MKKEYLHTWTKSAVMCYERGGVCNGCYYEDFFTKGTYDFQPYCKMKESVVFLVKKIGLPKNAKRKGVIDE